MMKILWTKNDLAGNQGQHEPQQTENSKFINSFRKSPIHSLIFVHLSVQKTQITKIVISTLFCTLKCTKIDS